MDIANNFIIKNRKMEEYRKIAEDKLKLFRQLSKKYPEPNKYYFEKLNNLHDCIMYLFKALLLTEDFSTLETEQTTTDDLYKLYFMISDKLSLTQDQIRIIRDISSQYKGFKITNNDKLILPLHDVKYEKLALELYNKIYPELLGEIIKTIPIRSS